MFGLHDVYKQIDPEVKKDESYQIVEGDIPMIEPFVWIHDVKEGSPAAQDGLQIGDAILDFGGIRFDNSGENALQSIVSKIQSSIGQPIEVRICRKNLVLGAEMDTTIKYTPRNWGGTGLLGCMLKVNPL